jgi:hypothetical protein
MGRDRLRERDRGQDATEKDPWTGSGRTNILNHEQRCAGLITDLTAIIEKYDDGLTTKAEMYETIRMVVEETVGHIWDDGFNAGIEDYLNEDGEEFDVEFEPDPERPDEFPG